MTEHLLNQLRAVLAADYSIRRQVGAGAFGIVFEAEDRLGRAVALKVVHSQLVEVAGSEHVLRELSVGARLYHPHILPILDCGEADGIVYYVTPFVAGESLRARLEREGQLPLVDALRIASEVGDALSYAHAHNVVHRDINPENILLDADHAVVKDFWVARALATTHRTELTATGFVLGWLPYMSPEQAAGTGDVDPRSDVYSLACLMYEMLAGDAPYSGPWAAPGGILARHLHEDVPPIQALRPSVPQPVSAAVIKGLAKSPSDRFGSPRDFVDALAAGPWPEPTAPMVRAMSLRPLWYVLALVLAMVLGAQLMRAGDGVVVLLPLIGAGVLTLFLLGRHLVRRQKTAGLGALAAGSKVAWTDHRGSLEDLRQAVRHRYTIEGEVGRGGMAIVYLAGDLRFHARKVALKALRPELAVSVASERFIREIEITAQLTHPLILPVLDAGDAHGLPFYVMPYFEGESLRQAMVREGPFELDRALSIARDVAAALDYAHRMGVVHRDIKPENILLYEGKAMVADFGIALALDASAQRLTEPGYSPGTPEYMSPEQFWDVARVDHRTDLYSLGCVVYEMLAGEPPYSGPATEIATRVLNAPVPHLPNIQDPLREKVDIALRRALAKSPDDRFQSAHEFAGGLG